MKWGGYLTFTVTVVWYGAGMRVWFGAEMGGWDWDWDWVGGLAEAVPVMRRKK